MKLNLLEFPHHHHHHRHNHKIRFKSCSSIFWRFFEPIRWIGKRLKGWTKVRDGGAHCGKLMTLFQRPAESSASWRRQFYLTLAFTFASFFMEELIAEITWHSTAVISATCSVNLFYCVSPYYGTIGVLVYWYGPHRERRSQEAGRPYNFLDALCISRTRSGEAIS